MKKTIALFGGTGGLGKQLVPMLEQNYKVISLSSTNVNVKSSETVNDFFDKNDIDIVINLSGYNTDGFLHKINSEDIDLMVDTNIKGSVNIVRAALPQMRSKSFGRVILISSVLATKVVPGTALYSGAKAFIDNLVKTASAENVSKGITCNSIQLGYFEGGMCHRLPEKFAESVKESIPLKRWGSIQELYQTIEYLINTEYITGQNINISGGI